MTEIFDLIPKPKETAISSETLISNLIKLHGYDNQYAKGKVEACLVFLNTFGILEFSEEKFKLSHQIPQYFIESLKWYINNNRPFFSNWKRSGTSREININNLPTKAPYLLKTLEDQRLRIIKNEKLDESFSRNQPCSIGLIKAEYKNKIYFLFQWDSISERFQLIGGKRRENETADECMVREINEEISQHELLHLRDYTITKLTTKPIKEYTVSRTYGTLTKYEIDLFEVKFLINDLKLDIIDRWISFEEIQKGKTEKDNKDIIGINLLEYIQNEIPSNFKQINKSFQLKKGLNVYNALLLKPSFLGIGIDLKKLLNKS